MAEEEGLEANGEAGPPVGSPIHLDPTAAALAAESAKVSPELAREAAQYFRNQSHLVEIQTEHLHEQRSINISLLKLRRFVERLKVGLQIVLIFAALVLAGALVEIIWSAVNDHHLVVDAFSVSPDLADRGETGRVIAAQVLDKLGQINAQANSTRAASSYAADWGEQAKLEIPETGISISELQRFFRSWLGHETHITGEVIHNTRQLALTIRAGDAPGRTVAAAESDLDSLTQQAAEAAFAITQPFRYSVYLDTVGRPSEALATARALTSGGPPLERAWAWSQVSNLLMESGDAEGAARAGDRSVEIDPQVPVAYMNAANGFYFLGDEERAYQLMGQVAPTLDAYSNEIAPDMRSTLNMAGRQYTYRWLGDYQDAIALTKSLSELRRLYGETPSLGTITADDLALNNEAYSFALAHDVTGSIRITSEHQISDADVLRDWAYEDDALVTTYERFVAQENWDAATADMRETIAAASRWPKFAPLAIPLLLQPRLVYALARGGHQEAAEQNAAILPQRCYRCARARGWVATMGKDWPRADQEFSDAVKQAPSLPMGYFEWGASLLQRGNPEAAIRQFAEAHKRGPHFADPLEGWGEALMAKNQSHLALAKFEEAEKYAPSWGRLHLKWGEALGYAGYKDEARAQYQIASKLDLGAADKDELARQVRS